MREKIAELASDMRRSFDILRQQAAQARAADPSLVLSVERSPLSLSVCAVDGGLLAQRVHGADIVISRSVAVNFIYSGSILKSFSYHPSRSPEPRLELKSSLDEHEADVFRSLVRLESEVKSAISSIERFSPDILLMDGSLLPLPSDRPEDGSELSSLYRDLLSHYQRLFSLSKEKGCMLCGVIKDSRAKRLADSFEMRCSDTTLCGYLLKEGERTKAIPYHGERKPPGKELQILAGKVSVFYLKPSEHDLPLRIEAFDCDPAKAASIVLALSAISETFAYPAVLIEADMCAALDPSEMESIQGSLLSMTGLRPLRRDSRPFR